MKLRDHKNSKKQGDAGLGTAIGWLTRSGYTVCVPLTDSQDFDLVVDVEGDLKRVQVKTTTHKNTRGRWVASLRVAGGNRSGTGKRKKFDPTKVDYLFVVTADDDLYWIPTFECSCESQLVLAPKYDKFKVIP